MLKNTIYLIAAFIVLQSQNVLANTEEEDASAQVHVKNALKAVDEVTHRTEQLTSPCASCGSSPLPKQCVSARYALDEIVTSEGVFLRGLNYATKGLGLYFKNGTLKKEDFDRMSETLVELKAATDTFYQKLLKINSYPQNITEQQLQARSIRTADTLKWHLLRSFKLYEKYISQQSKFDASIKEVEQNDKEPKDSKDRLPFQYMQMKVESNANDAEQKVALATDMLLPTQRFLKYSLLLRELKKHLKTCTASDEDVLVANVQKISDQASEYINKKKTVQEEKEKNQNLKNAIFSMEEKLGNYQPKSKKEEAEIEELNQTLNSISKHKEFDALKKDLERQRAKRWKMESAKKLQSYKILLVSRRQLAVGTEFVKKTETAYQELEKELNNERLSHLKSD